MTAALFLFRLWIVTSIAWMFCFGVWVATVLPSTIRHYQIYPNNSIREDALIIVGGFLLPPLVVLIVGTLIFIAGRFVVTGRLR